MIGPNLQCESLPARGSGNVVHVERQPEAIVVRRLDPLTDERDQVLRLYRTNSGTLGFFPQGALDEFVEEGCVIVAVAGGIVVGYLAYRAASNRAKIVHLCVGADRRGRGIATSLADELFRETANLEDVRLLCREDYDLNGFWARLGFVCMTEKYGRGKSGKKLFLWVRRNTAQPPLLAAIDAAARANRRTVAVDANVFYDFDGTDERSHESQGLLADWLEDDVAICVTAEIKNEISRHSDPELRARRRGQVEEFTVLTATPDQLEVTLKVLHALLPPSENIADESDRRQLAHAIAEHAEFFITRDEILLGHAVVLRVHAGIEVLRPTNFLVQLYSRSAERYAPVRLVATSVTEAPATSEAELGAFQRFALSETKAQWLQRTRPLLTDPQRFKPTVVSWQGASRAAYSVERAGSLVAIRLLRAQRDPRSPTVLRRLLAEILTGAQAQNALTVSCDDLGDPVVESALTDVGFVLRGERYEKWMMRAVVNLDALQSIVPAGLIDQIAASHLVERVCWPLKVQGADIPSYVIPIRPHWAGQLFDTELAAADLFGARLETALALENVYYSSSSVAIPEGARILWYVSDTVQAIRAAPFRWAPCGPLPSSSTASSLASGFTVGQIS